MKNRFYSLVVLTAVTLLSANLAALPNGNGGGGGKGGGKSSGMNKPDNTKETKSSDRGSGEADDLAERLSLTTDQKLRVKSIIESRDSQIQSFKKDKTLTREVEKQRSKEMKEQAYDKIRTILTPAQQATFDKSVHKGGGKKNKEKDAAPTTGATPNDTTGSTNP